VPEPFAPAPPERPVRTCTRRNPSEIHSWPALFMSASAAIARTSGTSPVCLVYHVYLALPGETDQIDETDSLQTQFARISEKRCSPSPARREMVLEPLLSPNAPHTQPLNKNSRPLCFRSTHSPGRLVLFGLRSQSSTIGLANPTQLLILSKYSYVFLSWLSRQLLQSASL